MPEEFESKQQEVKPANKKVIVFNFILIVVICWIIYLYGKCRWSAKYIANIATGRL